MKGTVQGEVPLKLTCCPSGVSTSACLFLSFFQECCKLKEYTIEWCERGHEHGIHTTCRPILISAQNKVNRAQATCGTDEFEEIHIHVASERILTLSTMVVSAWLVKKCYCTPHNGGGAATPATLRACIYQYRPFRTKYFVFCSLFGSTYSPRHRSNPQFSMVHIFF
jgi:hypothetical protein